MNTIGSCNDVRQSLVNSKLHYFISESPHSIWITIRKKFIPYQDNLNNDHEASIKAVPIKDEELEASYKDLEERNKELEAAFDNLRNELESEIGDHKVTKDANKRLNEQLMRKEQTNFNLKQEIKNMEATLEAGETNSKKSVKIVREKDKEIYELRKENSKSKEDLENAVKELRELKVKVSKDEKKSKKQEKKEFMNNLVAVNKQEEISCNMCDSKLLSFQNLKTHMRAQHMKQTQTQTDDISQSDKSSQSDESESAKLNDNERVAVFSKYQCFYCGFKIESKEHLRSHKNKCHEKSNFLKNIKSAISQKIFPPIGFPHIGFSPIGFPPNIPSSLPPLYSSWSKNF